jgi:hypothetical protein
MNFATILEKFTGGRFLLTIAACILLVKWGWAETMTDKLINTVENIVIFYFLRNDRNGGANGQNISSTDKAV